MATEKEKEIAGDEEDSSRIWLWALLAFLGVSILVPTLGWIALKWQWIQSQKLEASGQFGDSFGFANAVVSGLAFAGVIVTLLMQRKELELQRKELKLTRKELKLTRMSQQKTERSLFLASYLNGRNVLSKSI